MNLIAIAWGYVALMMALAEATSTQGSILGAVITFLLYGVLPISILLYVMGSPARRAAKQRQEQADLAAWRDANQGQRKTLGSPPEASAQTQHGHHTPPLRLPAEGEKP
ncbi:membrane protein implicated in regulation of membrane protease activity [Paucibacter oligotrophus]|uniref:Membrane protein implicated in regulation of membrane protease activity n=1 Tax=Roseateles oligotrophus TaxID=1769250 RepID=A0A840LJD4_9BURK|nr:hypothetical protein [Roseateles oligotrophus]MBB4845387.1 membrane protein implicated in regulation of membrane protease activity [Roseateles oligotrophus]